MRWCDPPLRCTYTFLLVYSENPCAGMPRGLAPLWGLPIRVTLIALNRHPYAVERGRSTENNVELLVPMEKDTSSCPFPDDCEAASRWEAHRQCFCASAEELR